MAETDGRKREPGVLKLILELGPLLVFFFVNARGGNWDLKSFGVLEGVADKDVAIMAATGAFMVATVLALSVSFALYRRVPVMPLISGIIVVVFGGLTLYLQDELFIKLKPTIVNLIFAATLLGGLFILKKPLLGIVFSGVFDLDEEGWRKLTLRWGLFFVFLAVLNEVVWRNFSTDTWVTFKVFGTMPITIIFTLCQLPLIQRHALPQN
ncbi:septation protein A [Acuticoccus sp. M5D2P5]|nr:septation protein A [Acuticoccus kalidii]MCF3936391.1 septation protein A [Acuticoccus kalidii]